MGGAAVKFIFNTLYDMEALTVMARAVRKTGNKKILKIKKIYGKLENEKVYARAVLDFISGMTDRFAIQVFNELLNY